MSVRMRVASIGSVLLLAITVHAVAQENRGGYSAPMAIPTGTWQGTGTYLDYKQIQAVGKVVSPRPDPQVELASKGAKSGHYETSLHIYNRNIDGMDVTIIEIESLRGKTQQLDDEATRVRLAIRERSRSGDNVVVLETVAWEYNPDLSKPVEPQKEDTWVTGTLMAVGDTVVLQVYYMVPHEGDSTSFYDTFIFRGNELLKSGSIVNHSRDEVDPEQEPKPQFDGLETRGMISWTEKLTRTKP